MNRRVTETNPHQQTLSLFPQEMHQQTIHKPHFKRWFGEWVNHPEDASQVTHHETGEPLVVYHGTQRPDRIVSEGKFSKKRATSGPMQYFTSDPEIASSYAEQKSDTSIDEPEDYRDWFFHKPEGARRPVNITDAWWHLSPEKRAELRERIPRVSGASDGDYENWMTHPPGKYGYAGKDHWDYELRQAKGNALEAAKETWLNSGTLFGQEENFVKLLREAGLPNVEFRHPRQSNPGVLPVYLNIRKPLVTHELHENHPAVQALRDAATKQRAKPNAYGADAWDKRTISAKDWIEGLNRDIKDKTAFSWTQIPDWVTNTLKEQGYDGIRDRGGKYTGGAALHDVWVPFDEHQIKSAYGNAKFDPDKVGLVKSVPIEKAHVGGYSRRTPSGSYTTVAPHEDSRRTSTDVEKVDAREFSDNAMYGLTGQQQQVLTGQKPSAAPQQPQEDYTRQEASVSPEEAYQQLGPSSPYFKRWFGDWESDPDNASHVRHETNLPRPMYAASGANIIDTGTPQVVGELAKRFPAYHFSDRPQKAPVEKSTPDKIAPEYRHPVLDHASRMMEDYDKPPISDEQQRLFMQTGNMSSLYPPRQGDPIWSGLSAKAQEVTSHPTPSVYLNLRNPLYAEHGLSNSELLNITKGDAPLLSATQRMTQERTGERDWTPHVTGMDVLNAYSHLGRTQSIPPALSSLGYDGIIHSHEGDGEKEYRAIAFKPHQIKATANTGTFDPAEEDIYKAIPGDLPEPYHAPLPAGGLHLNSERVIRNQMGAKAPAQHVRGMLKGLPEEELHYTGINDFLRQHDMANKPVYKHELLEHIANTTPRIRLSVSHPGGYSGGDFPQMEVRREHTIHKDRATYQEHVIHSPDIEPYAAKDTIHFGDVGEGKHLGWLRTHDVGGGLHIEELQSKRHQDAEKSGYIRPLSPEDKQRLAELQAKAASLYDRRTELLHARKNKEVAHNQAATDAIELPQWWSNPATDWQNRQKLMYHQYAFGKDAGGITVFPHHRNTDGPRRYTRHTYDQMDRDLGRHMAQYIRDSNEPAGNAEFGSLREVLHRDPEHGEKLRGLWKEYEDADEEFQKASDAYYDNNAEINKYISESTIPDAPMKGQHWKDLMLKHALLHAAEEGHSHISWNDANLQDQIYESQGGLSDNARERMANMYGYVGDKGAHLRKGDIYKFFENYGKRYGVAPQVMYQELPEPKPSFEEFLDRNEGPYYANEADIEDFFDEDAGGYVHPDTGEVYEDEDEARENIPTWYVADRYGDESHNPEWTIYHNSQSDAYFDVQGQNESFLEDDYDNWEPSGTVTRGYYGIDLTDDMINDLHNEGLPLWGKPMQMKKSIIIVQGLNPIIKAVGVGNLQKPRKPMLKSVTISVQGMNTDPTMAQKEAGNYRKGHIDWHGLDIAVENPKGSYRKGVSKSGVSWRVKMNSHYGYIRREMGIDGDPVDVFVGPNKTNTSVYVVDQMTPDGEKFDEHKVMLGYDDLESAKKAYLGNYTKGWKGLGAITEISLEAFRAWLKGSGANAPMSRLENM